MQVRLYHYLRNSYGAWTYHNEDAEPFSTRVPWIPRSNVFINFEYA